MAEVTFEHKFGQLADAQISERLPSLVEYRVGFQVIDKTDDDTKAVGIAAFILNGIWLYIPIFFVRGDLKGFDLLYIKQRDMFVPSMDNWIAALSQQGLTVIGKPYQHGDAGYEHDNFATPSNTQINDTYSQMGKSASLDSNAIIDRPTWDAMCKHLTTVDSSNYRPVDLIQDIPMLGKQAAQTFLNTLLSSTEFANSMFKFYDLDMVEKVARQCAVAATAPTPPNPNDILIVTSMRDKQASKLSNREKELLVRNGLYVRDNRSNFSKVFHEEIDSSVLQNPTIPGIYDVLLSNGEYKTYIVLTPKCLQEPSIISRRFQQNTGRPVCLVDIKDPKEYVRKKHTEVFCKPAVGVTDKDVKGLQGGRKATRQLIAGLEQDTNVLFVQSAQNSIETRINNRQSNPDGSFDITVVNRTGYNDMSRPMCDGLDRNQVKVEFTGPDTKLQISTGILFIPEGTRVFTYGSRGSRHGTYPKQFTPNEPSLGNSATVQQVIYKQANLKHIRIHSDGNTAQITTAEESSPLMSKAAALEVLMMAWGIEGGQALGLLKQAQVNKDSRKGFFIKRAAPYDTAAYGDSERPFMGGPRAKDEYAYREERQVVGGKQLTGPKDSQNNAMMPQQAIEKAMQSAEAGIKEVFDVGVLQGLVDKADISEMRKDYITDMIKGMDKVGRMLFLFYWHTEEFKERYGSEDMQKLEDTLRDVFTNTGDLVLFLKEKTAYSPDAAEAMFGSLSEDVGA